MRNLFFEFNLETGKVAKSTAPHYAVRYCNGEEGTIVEIGDGYRHELFLEAEHWNRILKIIKDDELDQSGIKAITRGLMGNCLPEEYEENFISAVKSRVIKEIK